MLLLISKPISVFEAFAFLLISIGGEVYIMQKLLHLLLFFGMDMIRFWFGWLLPDRCGGWCHGVGCYRCYQLCY